MPVFTIDEMLSATGGELWTTSRVRTVSRFSTDSRTLRPGDVFFALEGEHFNGHRFVGQAMERGARGVIVQRGARRSVLSVIKRAALQGRTNEAFIMGVDDTVRAYQNVAAFHRQRFAIPVVAVTGSNGKTTTKDMVAHVLSQHGHVLKTQGNLNNCLGLPQTLLRLSSKHEAAVVELGVDAEGQTTRLCEIAKPTHGVITNIGPDHLEFFGSIEGSARAKAELLACLPKDGLVVLNADDAYFGMLKQRASCRVLSFGLAVGAQIRGSRILSKLSQTTFSVQFPQRTRTASMSIAVQGRHNVLNALAAIAIGHAWGLSSRKIAAGLMRFRPAAMRSQVYQIGGMTMIQDCYNANPASMKAAIDLLIERGGSRRTIAVLGDMLELGVDSRRFHREIGQYLGEQAVSIFIACGARGEEMARGARGAGMPADRIHAVADAVTAAKRLRQVIQPGDVVLVKASRGMRMEGVVKELRNTR